MFILEEAIQSGLMACYLCYQAGDYTKMREIANYVQSELIDELLDFANGPAGILAYPMNDAYVRFGQAAQKTVNIYLTVL